MLGSETGADWVWAGAVAGVLGDFCRCPEFALWERFRGRLVSARPAHLRFTSPCRRWRRKWQNKRRDLK
jgi:hypothetical protein